MISEINKIYQNICNQIGRKQIKNALDNLDLLVGSASGGDFSDRLHNLEMTYENLLRYTIEGVEDPERKNIYNHLLVSILKLAD